MAQWQSGLCDCFDDCGICCYGCWCTPCLYGENAEKIDGSDCVVQAFLYGCALEFGCCCILHRRSRAALRNKYGLTEDPCYDCCVTTWCSELAVCQEARELKSRSYRTVPTQRLVVMNQPNNITGNSYYAHPGNQYTVVATQPTNVMGNPYYSGCQVQYTAVATQPSNATGNPFYTVPGNKSLEAGRVVSL